MFVKTSCETNGSFAALVRTNREFSVTHFSLAYLMRSASSGLQSSSHLRGVMPLVLFWNFSGHNSQKGLNSVWENI